MWGKLAIALVAGFAGYVTLSSLTNPKSRPVYVSPSEKPTSTYPGSRTYNPDSGYLPGYGPGDGDLSYI
ncbi:MAG: hypothetical protein KC422_23100 [Trueperaceae bacterium]|nr:hypothetical protein [Trueperaceae bacterium]